MSKTVADQFIDVLVAAGVKHVYGVVGDSLNSLTDSTLYMVKAIFDGQAGEVIDLAASNLWR